MSDAVQKIKEAADIVELISDFVPVKRSGANYLGLCPFHQDSKPSMYISPSKQIFKCFACGEGGDVFKFWSEYHQKPFVETLKDLANRYGITLEMNAQDQERSKTKNLFVKMHELAADYYTEKLLGSQEAAACRDYLKGRDISTETINKFKIGYSPADKNDWGKLIKFLKQKLEVTEEQIVKAGLANKSEKDPNNIRYYDRFRNRLMIAIQDERNRVIAFGARALKDPDTGEEATPKYLNSADSDIYIKGDHLYGLNAAKEHIRKQDAAIVVEGYFDVISLQQAGIHNVVANQGTALTAKQAKLLCKFSESKKIYLCFDTDKAGEDATERAIETIMQASSGLEAEIYILRVTGGKDPDEFIKEQGVGAFRDLVANAPLLFDYQIDKAIAAVEANPSPQSKRKAITQLAKYLNYITNQVERAEYIKSIAGRLNIDQEIIASQLNIDSGRYRDERENPYQTRQEQKRKPKPKTQRKSNDSAISIAERELLVVFMVNKNLLEEFMAEGEELVQESSIKILDAVTDITFENPELNDCNEKFKLVQGKLAEDMVLNSIMTDIGIELEKEPEKSSLSQRFQEALRKLKKEKLNQAMKEITGKIKALEASDNSEAQWIELQREKDRLNKELKSYQPQSF